MVGDAVATAAEIKTPIERHAAMTWAQRLKRVFNIDIETCGRCGGSLKVIACIEDQDIIDRILTHLRDKDPTSSTLPLLIPPSRAPPETLPLFAGKGARQQIPVQLHSAIKEASGNHMALTFACRRSGLNGYEWHAQHIEQVFWINKRELFQINKPSRQNQRGCLLSIGPLYFLCSEWIC